jgi:cytochrome P450
VNDDVLPGGVHVKAGTVIQYLIYAMGHDEDLWEHAHQFDPQRFVDHPAAGISK